MRPRFQLICNAFVLSVVVGLLMLRFAELRAEAQIENRTIQSLQLIRLRQQTQ